MTPIDRLIALDRESPKRIAVVGDPMRDVWRTGEVAACQEGCLRFHELGEVVETPGGAANAARQLQRWGSTGDLIAPWHPRTCGGELDFERGCTLHGGRDLRLPMKVRFVDPQGRIVFRHDDEGEEYNLNATEMSSCRQRTLATLRNSTWDAILISDYEKGFLEGGFIREIVAICQDRAIPVVADAKRPPGSYFGAVLKCNLDYAYAHFDGVCGHDPVAVVTCGAAPPFLSQAGDTADLPVPEGAACINHVGAGDCFSAHLALCLAHGIDLEEAIEIAHAAGQVYVRHRHGRPPWPHEIRKQLDPVGGKVVEPGDLDALRQSTSGRLVFTNGVFRVPHAGHAYLMRWARQQGDVLVVGVNDDVSASRLRHGQVVLPLAERVEMLAGLEAVDWVVPFAESDPCAVVRRLKPHVLVKGAEYAGQHVPGDDLVADVRFAPPGPHERHCTDLARVLAEGG